MKKILITILQYVIFLGLGIWIIYHMLHSLTDQQKNELLTAIRTINAWYLIPIVFIGFLSHLFRAIRWRYLLETVDCNPTIANTTFAVMIGYLTNMAIPRAGEVAKCTVLARYEKLPPDKMIGTIVAERAFDMFCLVLITIAAFSLQMNVISNYAHATMGGLSAKLEQSKSLLIAAAIALPAGLVIAVLLYRKYKNSKIGKFITGLLGGITSIFRMKKRGMFLLYTLLIWLMYTLQLYVGFRCLAETTHLSFLAALVILVWGSVGMIVTPGGIGLYTLMVAQILAVYNIPEVPAQAFGWVSWLVQTAVIVVLGLFSLLYITPYNRRKDAKTRLDTAQNI